MLLRHLGLEHHLFAVHHLKLPQYFHLHLFQLLEKFDVSPQLKVIHFPTSKRSMYFAALCALSRPLVVTVAEQFC
jgi:hypothetical protein